MTDSNLLTVKCDCCQQSCERSLKFHKFTGPLTFVYYCESCFMHHERKDLIEWIYILKDMSDSLPKMTEKELLYAMFYSKLATLLKRYENYKDLYEKYNFPQDFIDIFAYLSDESKKTWNAITTYDAMISKIEQTKNGNLKFEE